MSSRLREWGKGGDKTSPGSIVCVYCYFYQSVYLLHMSSHLSQGNTPGYHEWVFVISSLSVTVDIVEILLFIILTFGGLFGKGVTT